VAQRIRDDELGLEQYPDQALLLDRLTWDLYWFGFYVGLTRDQALLRARNLARLEWELDEGEEGVGGIFTLSAAGYQRDTTGLTELARDFLEEEENDPYFKWYVGIMLPDSALAAEARAEGVYEQRPPGMFEWYNVLEGRPRPDALADLERAIEAVSRRVRTTREQTLVLHRRLELAVYRGRPEEAISLLDTLSKVDPDQIPGQARNRDAPEFYFTLPITHALVEDGWEEAVPWAIAELRGRNPALSRIPAGDLACMAAIGEVVLGRVEEEAARIPRFREAQDEEDSARVCVATLEALVAHEFSGPGLPDAVRRLDDLLRTSPPMGILGDGANLYLAQMLAARDELELAVAALKRRPYRGRSLHIMAPYTRLEGRLLALTGDTAGALSAYQHYLALRQHPEPVLQAQKDSALTELDAILEANPAWRANLEPRNVSLAGDSR
jgi:hypothetical protein